MSLENYREVFNKKISKGNFRPIAEGGMQELIAKSYPIHWVDTKFIYDLRIELIFLSEDYYQLIISKFTLFVHECQFYKAGNKIMIYKSKKVESQWGNMTFDEKSKYWVGILKKVERVIIDNISDY